MLSRRFPSRPESSASPGAGGARTTEPEPLSPPPSQLGLPSASPFGHELPAHSRRLQAQCPPAAGSSGGGGAAPALSGFLLPTHPTPFTAPPSCPRRGAPLSSVLPPAGVPTLQQAPEPGQHLVSTIGGGGGGGGRALPLAPLSRRTDGGDSAGLRIDPGSPGLCSGAAEFYPAPPGLRASEGAIGPDGTGRGTTGWKGLG